MPFYTTEPFHNWKVAKQKEQLNRAFIEAGFCPSRFLMEKLTILREKKENYLKEEFYLSHNTVNEKLLLICISSESGQVVTLERRGGKPETFIFEENTTALVQK